MTLRVSLQTSHMMWQNGEPMQYPFALSAGGNSLWASLVEWYQNSLICEILTYLEEKYFSVTLGSYENFAVSASTGVNMRNIILGLAIGLIVASAMIAHTRSRLGGFVRTMLREDCTSPEKAKTLLELGYFQNPSIRRELKKRVTLGKLVCCKEEEEAHVEKLEGNTEKENKPFVLDFTSMHFYIPEDLRYRAEIRFEKKGSSWGFFAIIAVATVIVAALMCIFMPDLFQLTDNLIGFFS